MPYQINLPDDEMSDDIYLTPDQLTEKRKAEAQAPAESETTEEEQAPVKEEADGPGTLVDEIVLKVDEMLTDRDPEADVDARDRYFQAKEQRLAERNPLQVVGDELSNAVAGGGEDLLEGIYNLGVQGYNELMNSSGRLAEAIGFDLPDEFFDREPVKADFNLVPENSTGYGKAIRTITRYVHGGRLFGGKISAGQAGLRGYGLRAVEDFAGDFVAADGTAEDTTLIGDVTAGLFGSTPFSQAIQTSDENHPLHNRALVGLDGALTSAGLYGVGEVVGPKLKAWAANRAARQADKTIREQGPRASKQLFDRLSQEYWDQSFENSKSLEQNLIREGWRDNVLDEIIEEVAGGNETLKTFLKDRTDAIVEADRLDDIYFTAKFGGDPAEEVVDGIELTGTFKELDDIDVKIEELERAKATLANQVDETSRRLTAESTAVGRFPTQIADLQARSMDAPRLDDLTAEMTAIPFNLSTRQVEFIQSLRKLKGEDGKRVHKFPLGITITAGRRIKGLNSGNIDDFLDIIRQGPDSDQKTRLLMRFENAERPAFNPEGVDTIESLNAEVAALKAQQETAGATAAATRVELEPMNQQLAEVNAELAKQLLLREGLYSKFNGQNAEFLERAETLKSGESALSPQQIDEVVAKTDEAVAPTTRKEAMEAGKNAEQLVPTKPRGKLMGPHKPDYVSKQGTAAPIEARTSNAMIRSLARSPEALQHAIEAERKIATYRGMTDSEIAAKVQDPDTARIAKEYLELAADSDIVEAILEDPRIGYVDPQGILRKDPFGTEVLYKIIDGIHENLIEIPQALARQVKDGMPEAAQSAEQLIDNYMGIYQLQRYEFGATGDKMRQIRESSTYRGISQDNPLFQRLAKPEIEKLEEGNAQTDLIFRQLQSMRNELRVNPKKALRELGKFADALNWTSTDPKSRLNTLKTLLSANAKNVDAVYVGNLLSGPGTQSTNFWSGFYMSTGQPLLQYFGSIKPGAIHAQSRREAVAKMSATINTHREMVSLLGRIWNNTEPAMAEAGQYIVWDKDLYKEMMHVKQKLMDGKANAFEKYAFNVAEAAHKVLNSPMFEPIRKVMGTMDQYFRVAAARQVATQRAVDKAIIRLNDRPPTPKSAQEFGEFVTKQTEIEMLGIVDESGVVVIDDEAIELGDTFTFQKTIGQADRVTQRLSEIASIPGAKFLGLTFVKTPSLLAQASINLFPGLSTIAKHADPKYRKGSPRYRAVRDGVEGMSYLALGFAALEAGFGNLTGAGPIGVEEQKLWRQNGNKPFTYKKFGMEIDYRYLDPLATVVGIVADSTNIAAGNMHSYGNPGIDLLSVIGSNFINKSYLAQISQVAELVTASTEGDLKKIGMNKWRGMQYGISFRSQLGEAIDPFVRETRSKIEPYHKYYLAKQTGFGATMHSPHRLDPLTAKPLTREGYGFGAGNLLGLVNLIRPFGLQFSKERHDPIHKLLYKHGLRLDTDTRELANQGMDNAQISKFIELQAADGRLRSAFKKYFNSTRYKGDLAADEEHPPEDLKDSAVYESLRDLKQPFTEAARDMMMYGNPEHPETMRFADDLEAKRQELLEKYQTRQKALNRIRFEDMNP